MLKVIRLWADRLIDFAAFFGALALIFEVVIILIDVIGRAFHHPLYGSQDLVTMSMVVLVFGGMPLCDRRGGHIAVDIFEKKFSERTNRVIDIAAAIIGMVIFTMIAIAVWQSAKLSVMLNLSTNLLNLPKVYFQWILSGFAVIAALGFLLRAIELSFGGYNVMTHMEEPL